MVDLFYGQFRADGVNEGIYINPMIIALPYVMITQNTDHFPENSKMKENFSTVMLEYCACGSTK